MKILRDNKILTNNDNEALMELNEEINTRNE